MKDLQITILPNGEIHISRSIDYQSNEKMLEILSNVVEDTESLENFLKAANTCEQIIGDEPLCG